MNVSSSVLKLYVNYFQQPEDGSVRNLTNPLNIRSIPTLCRSVWVFDFHLLRVSFCFSLFFFFFLKYLCFYAFLTFRNMNLEDNKRNQIYFSVK